ncbi:MAG: copper transporter [Frankiales bacterium]|nr:copper transporter [Frankiales bacterium]
MISFRYHLVSVIAVFLAIALGVVIGTSALNGAVVGDLRRQVSDLKSTNQQDDQQNKALQLQAGNADLLARSYGAKIAGSVLANVPVVLVAAPGAPATAVDSIAASVARSGGKLVARIRLTASLVDPSRANDVRSLATSGVHPIGLQLPATGDAGALAGSLLGFTLLGKGQATDLTQVLSGFGTLNMVKIEGGSPTSGKLVIVVAPGSAAVGDLAEKSLLSMTTQIATTGGPTVVAGDSASASQAGLISLIRADPTAKQVLSTVDDAQTSLGQLTVALTGAETLAGRKGQYGTTAGVDALMPGAGS